MNLHAATVFRGRSSNFGGEDTNLPDALSLKRNALRGNRTWTCHHLHLKPRLVTLGLVALASIGVFLFFLRKRSNREAASRALTDGD